MPLPDSALSSASDQPVSSQTLWRALIREPNTGVSIIDDQGVLTYLNDQGCRIFFAAETNPQAIIGRSLKDFYPADVAAERQKVVHRAIAHDKPILYRSIWQGYQHFSWVYPIHDEARDPTGKALIITRRIEGASNAVALDTDGFERVDADIIDLGELSNLTTRELVVMALLGQGFSLKDTARQLHRSVRTIETQRDSIARKLDLADRAELIELARRVGLRCDDAFRQKV